MSLSTERTDVPFTLQRPVQKCKWTVSVIPCPLRKGGAIKRFFALFTSEDGRCEFRAGRTAAVQEAILAMPSGAFILRKQTAEIGAAVVVGLENKTHVADNNGRIQGGVTMFRECTKEMFGNIKFTAVCDVCLESIQRDGRRVMCSKKQRTATRQKSCFSSAHWECASDPRSWVCGAHGEKPPPGKRQRVSASAWASASAPAASS